MESQNAVPKWFFVCFQVKEDESPTLEAVKSIQDTTVLLHKTKEIYKQRCAELEKLKRDNASSKDLEKAESKFRKAQDDYKSLVDKYCLGIVQKLRGPYFEPLKQTSSISLSYLVFFVEI